MLRYVTNYQIYLNFGPCYLNLDYYIVENFCNCVIFTLFVVNGHKFSWWFNFCMFLGGLIFALFILQWSVVNFKPAQIISYQVECSPINCRREFHTQWICSWRSKNQPCENITFLATRSGNWVWVKLSLSNFTREYFVLSVHQRCMTFQSFWITNHFVLYFPVFVINFFHSMTTKHFPD